MQASLYHGSVLIKNPASPVILSEIVLMSYLPSLLHLLRHGRPPPRHPVAAAGAIHSPSYQTFWTAPHSSRLGRGKSTTQRSRSSRSTQHEWGENQALWVKSIWRRLMRCRVHRRAGKRLTSSWTGSIMHVKILGVVMANLLPPKMWLGELPIYRIYLICCNWTRL